MRAKASGKKAPVCRSHAPRGCETLATLKSLARLLLALLRLRFVRLSTAVSTAVSASASASATAASAASPSAAAAAAVVSEAAPNERAPRDTRDARTAAAASPPTACNHRSIKGKQSIPRCSSSSALCIETLDPREFMVTRPS